MPDFVQNIFLVFGGLGLFLYGMKMMLLGLEKLAGNRMRTVVERATSNRFLGIGVGAAVTVIIQSSTATSVMAVGFINAGLMSLAQAISIIIGAHIGTTLTAHIFTFGISAVAPLFIFIGLVMYLFFSKKRVNDIGFIILGIGVLFFGLSVMGDPLRIFAQTPGFQSLLTAFENPFLAVFAGFLFTAIIQSSTAATVILISLYQEGADINFASMAYMVLGISVGTTVTALIASLAGKRESKRAALANLIFITIGCVIFAVLISIFPGILTWFQRTWADGDRQMAMFYTFFKVGLTIMFLPFVGHLAALMYKLIPKRTQWVDTKQLMYIKSDAQTPAIAIEQAFNELKRMGTMALINLNLALDVFHTGDEEKITGVYEGDSSISYLDKQITSMLMELQNVDSADDMKKLSTLLYISSDYLKIGALTRNIVEYDIRTKKKKKSRLHPEAIEELNTLGKSVTTMMELTSELFETLDEARILEINGLEMRVNAMSEEYTKNHARRLKNEKGDPRGGIAFVGMVSDLERCADHANAIAKYFRDKAMR